MKKKIILFFGSSALLAAFFILVLPFLAGLPALRVVRENIANDVDATALFYTELERWPESVGSRQSAVGSGDIE